MPWFAAVITAFFEPDALTNVPDVDIDCCGGVKSKLSLSKALLFKKDFIIFAFSTVIFAQVKSYCFGFWLIP